MFDHAHVLTVRLTADSDYLQLTFKKVVDHIHKIILDRGFRAQLAGDALDIILTLVEKRKIPSNVAALAWIDELLGRAAVGRMRDDLFAKFLRLRGLWMVDDATSFAGPAPVEFETSVPNDTLFKVEFKSSVPKDILFNAIWRAIKDFSGDENGCGDQAMYGGLVTIRGMLQQGPHQPDPSFLKMLYEAMEDGRQFRIRRAALQIIHGARELWLKSESFQQILKDNNFIRQMHKVVTVTNRSDHRGEFIEMIGILSEDERWHSYLRESMDMWCRHYTEAPERSFGIIVTIGRIPLPDVYTPALKSLADFLKDEWARVPGRGAGDLTSDKLAPFADVTKKLAETVFKREDRDAILVAVERVIPSLQKRHERISEDIRGIVDSLLKTLREPIQERNLKQHPYNY